MYLIRSAKKFVSDFVLKYKESRTNFCAGLMDINCRCFFLTVDRNIFVCAFILVQY